MSLLLVQNLPHEHEGVLGEVLSQRGITTSRWRGWAEPDHVPEIDRHDAVVVLGGDMNTDEEERWPHLARTRLLLTEAVEADMPVLGLCLGAQLLAEATGGEVHHGVPEIGYIPIHRTAHGERDAVLCAVPDATPFFNAHADQIVAPPDASVLAASEHTPVHAFRVGSGLGLQFHPEIDAAFVAEYVTAPGVEDYLRDNGWTPAALLAEARRHDDAHRMAGAALFAAWVEAADLIG